MALPAPEHNLSDKIERNTISAIKYELGRFLAGHDPYTGKFMAIVYGSCRFADGQTRPVAQDECLSDDDRQQIIETVESPLTSILLLFESHIDTLKDTSRCNFKTIASLLVAYRVMKDSGTQMLPTTNPCRSIAVANLERSLAIIALETSNSAIKTALTSALTYCQSAGFISTVLGRPLDTAVTLPIFRALSLSDYHQPLMRSSFARATNERGFIVLRAVKLASTPDSPENDATEVALSSAALPPQPGQT